MGGSAGDLGRTEAPGKGHLEDDLGSQVLVSLFKGGKC